MIFHQAKAGDGDRAAALTNKIRKNQPEAEVALQSAAHPDHLFQHSRPTP
ncbi:MAG: hypothetical protein U5K35_17975 [Rhodohalobacter sp.]|nr:hypothetical protein [Rhodohalobacter sp.]